MIFIQRHQGNIIGCLRQYYRDEALLDKNNNIDFPANNNNSILFKFKQITEQIGNGGTKDV